MLIILSFAIVLFGLNLFSNIRKNQFISAYGTEYNTYSPFAPMELPEITE